MDWKKIGKHFLYPPVWLIGVLSAFSAVSLTAVFVKGMEQSIAAYIVYPVAGYALTTMCLFLCRALPKQSLKIKQKFCSTSFGSRYVTDQALRSRSGMYLSLYLNLLYVGINLLSWLENRSWWFVVLMGYYLLLAFLWALLAGYIRSNPIGSNQQREWKRARTSATILLTINVFLTGAVLMILYRNRGFAYPGILIYVMAMYSFYSTIHAAIDLVKYRSLGSPVMATAKTVRLSAALVSLLNLETAMFAQFGAQMPVEDQHIFIILTGAGVSIIVVMLSVFLIVNATKEIRREDYGEERRI